MTEVVCCIEGRAGRLRLDRPGALHALTEPMCAAMIAALLAWRDDPAVELVLIDHAAGSGFCAGGDVRAVAASAGGDGTLARRFFFTEYRLNHLLFTYPKPVVAMLDGVVMGGGVGLGLPARYRIGTERTLFAMPEATIGLFPDVGAGRYLSRLPGRVGAWLALTAARLGAADCLALGLTTHQIAADRLEEVKAALIAGDTGVADLLDQAHAPPAGEPTLTAQRPEIDRLFAADTLEAIEAALVADGGDWAQATVAGLRRKSPTSCKVALRLLREAAARDDFAAEMHAEYAIAVRLSALPDFAEGVRALLVDKDQAPRWSPAAAEAVTAEQLDAIFAPLAPADAWSPLPG